VEEHACFLLGIVLGLPILGRDIKRPIVGDVKGIKKHGLPMKKIWRMLLSNVTKF
jgi:hypothetical protein